MGQDLASIYLIKFIYSLHSHVLQVWSTNRKAPVRKLVESFSCSTAEKSKPYRTTCGYWQHLRPPCNGGSASRRGRRRVPHSGTWRLRNYDAIPETISRSKGYKTKVSDGSTSAYGTGSKLGEKLLRSNCRRILGNMSEYEGREHDRQHVLDPRWRSSCLRCQSYLPFRMGLF